MKCFRRELIVSFALVFAFVGCTVKEAIEVVQPSGFITSPEKLQVPKDTPFDRAWVSPHLGVWLYSTLLVQAVRTDFVDQENWIFSASTFIPTRGVYRDKLSELADYIQETVASEFTNHDEKTMELVVLKGLPLVSIEPSVPLLFTPLTPKVLVEAMNPMSRALSLEISISDANFSDPFVYAGLLALPVPAVANLSSAVKSPSLTLEAKFVDQASGEVVWEIIDRRFPQLKVIDLNRLTVSSALREIADSFAVDLVESFYKKGDQTVYRRSPISLWPF